LILFFFVLQQGLTALYIAQKLGYISVVEVLKNVTKPEKGKNAVSGNNEDKYKVVAPEMMQENFMSDSEDEGGKHFFGTLLRVVLGS
jgi:ankyrin